MSVRLFFFFFSARSKYIRMHIYGEDSIDAGISISDTGGDGVGRREGPEKEKQKK